MDTLSLRTQSATPATITKEWVVVDATDQILGRLCAKVAKILRGKNKTNYTPNLDCGDNVIIINADKVKLTGNKLTDRIYLRYTGYPGGQRQATAETLMKKSLKLRANGHHPLYTKVMKGMLPKNRLGKRLLDNLYVYNGSEHPHAAHEPKVIDINKVK
ncbi:MAG: 50S ribosomal protein L13 [Bacteroidales bacterium]|nr:50S ribosomal protein L13 [Bacteroidales bacterium]